MSVAELVCAVVLSTLGRGADAPSTGDGPVGLLFAVPILAFPTVGAVVASRRPDHPIGWLFLAIGVLFGLGAMAPEYARYSLYASPGSLPATSVFVWSSTWIDPIVFLSIALALLVFPTGSLPSRRWRPVLWLSIGAAVSSFVTSAVKPGPVFQDTLPVDNPLGVSALENLLDAIGTFVWLALAGAVVLAGVSVIVRYRRSHGEERVQLKWIAFAALILVLGFLGANATSGLGPVGDAVVGGAFAVSLGGVPVAAGIAILRYRLFEIDVIIRRTLVYGVLSALLAGCYAGIVLALQAVFGSLTQGNEFAVACSTLAVAALFRPLRRRVQAVVDRRFYRNKVNAEATLAGFGARLRHEADLDTLVGELHSVVGQTLSPSHVSLWLRAEARNDPETVAR